MSSFDGAFGRAGTFIRRQLSLRVEVRERMAAVCRDNPEWFEDAARQLERRLRRTSLPLPPRTRSRRDKWPHDPEPYVPMRQAHPVDIMIARALSRTWGAAQFGCSPKGNVFTADTDGWSLPKEDRRDDVTGISPLLEEAADIFNSLRRGRGGRFYERDGCFFDADDRSTFFCVDLRDDIDLDDWQDPVGGLLPEIFAWFRQ